MHPITRLRVFQPCMNLALAHSERGASIGDLLRVARDATTRVAFEQRKRQVAAALFGASGPGPEAAGPPWPPDESEVR